MKLLVFSDSHGNTALMEQAVRTEKPAQVLHLGDELRDVRALAQVFPQLPLEYVPGNCDRVSALPMEKLLRIEGRTLLMAHGHTYGVKAGIGGAMAAARGAGADILLFGHTHVPLCDLQGALWILNPGTIRGPFSTYGVVLLEPGETVCYTVSIS